MTSKKPLSAVHKLRMVASKDPFLVISRKEAFNVDPRLEPVGYSPEQFQDWIPLVWEIQQTGTLL